jgi:site-specific DNA-methyltransferase (adenine-specific)
MINKVHLGDWTTNKLEDKSVQLIIADPPYFEVKGEFDFVWNSFDDYLKDVEKWAIECKRVLADNGTLFWYGDAKKIAYTQIIFDKYFNLLNNIVWENTNQTKQSMVNVSGYRSFPPLTERILLYEKSGDRTGGEIVFEKFLKPKNPYSKYLKEQFKKANITNKEISKLFPSKTGGLTGCVSNWLNGDNVITKEQYLKIRDFLNNKYLLKEYEELRKEYEELRKEYEELRRPFNNSLHLGDVIRLPNYETNKFKHDTIKPEKLTRILLQTCSRKGDLVLVPFAGSGTECAMAAKEGREFIGFDIESKYVDIANARCSEHLKQTSLF